MPESLLGAPFADPNFKLVVLDDLRSQGIVDLGTPQQFATHVLGRPVDLEQEGYSLLRPCLDYLYRYPLSPEMLQQVTTICFDGGLEIYSYVFYHWSGETDDFDVASIAGITQCPNITTYDQIALCSVRDASLLSALKKLEVVSWDPGPPIVGLEALLSLPALREVAYFEGSIEASGAALLKALRARGVRIKQYC